MSSFPDKKINLLPVDKVEIVILMDNMIDYLLEGSEQVIRPPYTNRRGILRPTRVPLLAEHGVSLLINLSKGQNSQTILFDAGYSEFGVPHNLASLEVDLKSINTLVLSHGHIDHFGALLRVLDQIHSSIPLVVHPDAFVPVRYVEFRGNRLYSNRLERQDLLDRDVQVIESVRPHLSPDRCWAVTGEIPRMTDFEKGLPGAWLERKGRLERDYILDDQALIISVKGKGLVILSGCGHAGVVNTIKYALKITGQEQIHAVIGGFHLSGREMESIREETIQELRVFEPDMVVPMHCTGFAAIARLKEVFPKQHILSSVGTKLVIHGTET